MRPLRLLLLAVALAIPGCGGDDPNSIVTPADPTPVPVPSSAEVLQRGAYGVGVSTVTFIDTSRGTPANGTFPASPTRRLVTEIWYPAAPNPSAPASGERDAALDRSGGKYPLILYSHGFSDARGGGGYIGRHLASHGYIVVAPDFPLTSFASPGGPNGGDLQNQPGDQSFILDSLLAGTPDARFRESIDTDRIGAGGLSAGGLTTYLLTYHPRLRDPRIRAAVSLAGVGCSFDNRFYDHAAVPLLILHGTLDAIVPYAEHGLFAFSQANAPKYLMTIVDGTHTAFSEFAAILFDQLDNADELGCNALGNTGSAAEEDDGPFGLGGEEDGIIDGVCPQSCRPPFPPAIRPPHQRELALLGVLPFFEGYLRNRAEMRAFLQQKVEAENQEVTLQFE